MNFTNAGLRDLAQKAVAGELVLRLFVNDFHPDKNTTLASFVEAQGGGYEPIPLTEWDADDGWPVLDKVFSFTGYVGWIHGAYVTSGDQVIAHKRGFVFYEQETPNPAHVVMNGDSVQVKDLIKFEGV